MDEKIIAELRVVGTVIKSHMYGGPRKDGLDPFDPENLRLTMGEVMEVKAAGIWKSDGHDFERYPVSLHITVYPGCGAIPVIGDKIRVTVEQACSVAS